MKILTEHNFARVGAIAAIVAITALGPYELQSSMPPDHQVKRVLLQGEDIRALVVDSISTFTSFAMPP